ncbi:pyridoxamine--pyruvate transaminase [Tistlia consotensis]|uniref:Pyridoxamine--pyruvate transaminase n=1 Tax=Tistlia consotensis USBA 355 TaxID=560819 RepID=A0A1Y6CJE3_9PROT|nr:alanine--glyoxylate aminotransferase family protein [Tistlia consotensis]SMF57208.1 pyridoxamine--pyruvate transaminase [Tistlia consotensis USBA 355]SNR45533.1 pyridoxamine--pyruvate transaminase [Tistlia consotensis]
MTDAPLRKPVITLTAGPVQGYSEVLQAMARPLGYDYDPWFLGFYEAVAKKCAQALRWPEPALIVQAEPAVAIEAAAASVIGRRDVVLNLASGVYGKGFGYWSARYHKEMVEIEVPYDEAIDPAAVAAALQARPDISVVSVVHHDTPSGTINPLVEIGEVVHAHGAVLIVDAVSSFGGMDIHPADCHADVFITGPGKCLGGTPGVTFVAVSDKAWQKMEANPDCPFASILSLKDWKNAWRRDQPFPFTPSVAEISGLDAAIDLYLEEGPQAVWARHALTAAACRAGIKALGCELWAAREAIASPTTTSVKVPEALSDDAIIEIARQRYGVMLSIGRGETLHKLIRIGHMGPTAEPVYALVAVAALGGALKALGFPAKLGAGLEAAQAVIDAARG